MNLPPHTFEVKGCMMKQLRKWTAVLLAAALFLCGVLPTEAYSTGAVSTCIMDADTGRVLYENNAHEQRPIASITKIMTGLLACEYGQEDESRMKQVLVCSETANAEKGSSLYMEVGDKILYKDCIYGCMLRSGNDAAMLLAETIAGSGKAFVKRMNERAAQLGMEDTKYGNPNGLTDKGNRSSAYDMCLLGRCAMENELFCQVVKTTYIETKKYGWKIENHNNGLLEGDKRCIGIKTGYTDKAGKTLVSCFQDPDSGQRVIICTLADSNDREDHIKGADWAFEHYPARTLCEEGEAFSTLISAQTGEEVRLEAAETLTYPLKSSETRKVKAVLSLPQNEVPLFDGETAGKAAFYLNGTLIGETELLVNGL